MRPNQFHLILPLGTKVLTKSGARVGVVSHVPSDSTNHYRVRFADGAEQSLSRAELTIFKHADSEIPGAPAVESLYVYVELQCIVGSRAYGLEHSGSDVDRRGCYLPPASLHWGLPGVPEQLETEEEECYWEIEKFIRLALKANPNVLECLYSPLVEKCGPIAQQLLDSRSIFLSRHVHRTYNSYVLSQFKKLEQDLRNQHTFRWKHVMHLVRLLLSGITVLKEGFLPLRVERHRDQLLAIREGEIAWEEIERWRLKLHQELDDAVAASTLPEHPDYRAANELLLCARRYAASAEYEGLSTRFREAQ